MLSSIIKTLIVLTLGLAGTISAQQAAAAPKIVAYSLPIEVFPQAFNRNLTLGSMGADVGSLQLFLEAKGFLVLPAEVERGYYGKITRAAVVAWQRASGISPASGYLGPISRAHLNATRFGNSPAAPARP